jgi:DNA-binding MarR family transcriptional regulator
MAQQRIHRLSSAEECVDAIHRNGNAEFVLVEERRPPSRIELARERMLVSRLYLGLIRSISDDYGVEFAARSDSLAYRTIGIYVFLRTVMCSPVRASQIARALKMPRALVLRRLQEMVKHGYVERVGNAYRITDKVNIPELRTKLQRRIDMITETARKLSELSASL